MDTVYGNDSSHYLTVNCALSLAIAAKRRRRYSTPQTVSRRCGIFSDRANPIAQDATINAYNGSPNGAITDTAGVIGNAKVLDGQTGYFAMAGTASGKLNFPRAGRLPFPRG